DDVGSKINFIVQVQSACLVLIS
ncbi:MAG: hypothetical protein JWO91_1, partial [Acidobacteriaceae bacterium]|nr:hypothetical protein [Acidobacteriaceae bacterium]